jgi:hypothetical protein
VTPDLIERVRRSIWNPEADEGLLAGLSGRAESLGKVLKGEIRERSWTQTTAHGPLLRPG